MNKLPLIPKSYLLEQSFVNILDPTSILFKNVTPYCSRFSEIQNLLAAKLATLEGVCSEVSDHFSAADPEPDDQTIEAEFRRRLQAKTGATGNLVAGLFGLPAFRLELD